MQASGILNQLAKISKKIHHFYRPIQKQFCGVHMFTCCTLVLPVAANSAIILPMFSTTMAAKCLNACERSCTLDMKHH
jgi:hypothetical protein